MSKKLESIPFWWGEAFFILTDKIQQFHIFFDVTCSSTPIIREILGFFRKGSVVLGIAAFVFPGSFLHAAEQSKSVGLDCMVRISQ